MHSFRMSQAGWCPRALYYDAMGFEPRVRTFRQQVLLDDGWLHEEDMLRRLAEAGYPPWDRQAELVRGESPYMLGHIDGMVEWEGRPYLLEVKGLSHLAFLNLVEHGVEHFPLYYMQVQAYLAHRRPYDCVFIAKNKDNSLLYGVDVKDGAIVGFNCIVPFSPPAFKAILSKLDWVNYCLNKEEMPSRECAIGDPMFLTCNFPHICYEPGEMTEEPELIEAAATWREGKALRDKGEMMNEMARGRFKGYMGERGLRKLEVQGLSVSVSEKVRVSYPAKKVETVLPPSVYETLRSEARFEEMRVVDRRRE